MIKRLPEFVKMALVRCGFRLRLRSEDRRILESEILPYVGSQESVKRVLFVGCDWYSAWYGDFFQKSEYWTLEINPNRRVYGAKNHIIGGVQEVSEHFKPDSLDVVICNGVFGCGLNTREDADKAFAGISTCLRSDGIFVLGWNNSLERKPFSPEESADKYFSRFVFPPLKQWRFPTTNPNGHVFDFYKKPNAGV